MKKKVFLLSLQLIILLSLGCTRYSEFIKTDKKIMIRPIGAEIEKVSPIAWRVGPRRKQKISKGFEIKIKFPELEKDRLRTLLLETDINSWLVTLRKRTLTRNRVLSRSYIPLVTPGTNRFAAKGRMKQMKYGFLRVFYPAAALSKRFENFPCPALKHSLLISKFKLETLSKPKEVMTISPARKKRVYYPLHPFRYDPRSINGGDSLTGNYEIEIAFFNYESKTLFSDHYKLIQRVKILKEKSVEIVGCENFKIPEVPEGSSDSIEQFKFGR